MANTPDTFPAFCRAINRNMQARGMRFTRTELKIGDGVECSGNGISGPCLFIEKCDKHAIVVMEGDRIAMTPANPSLIIDSLLSNPQ